MVSSAGIMSIRGIRDSGVKGSVEDPMTILQKGYSVTILLAVITFGAVILHPPLLLLSFSLMMIEEWSICTSHL